MRKAIAAGVAALLLAGCVSTPTGPSVLTLPGQGKSYEQFRADDYECRQYAQSLVGTTADQAAADAGARSVALGAALGALIGATGGRGGEGAAIGAAGGAIAGTGAASQSAAVLQQRYDNGYVQCMYARGNQVPMAGRYSAPSRPAAPAAPSAPQGAPPIPPPPPDLPPPHS
jgi:hypothetical protein